MRRIILFTVLFFSVSLSAEPEIKELNVTIDSTPFTHRIYIPIFLAFEKEFGIKINRIPIDDLKLFDNEETWYRNNGQPIDVINGQVSYRLLSYYRSGKLLSLNDFWKSNQLNDEFGGLQDLVTYDGEILALPYVYYGWQIFYLKSIVGENFKPPKKIEDLALLCRKLNDEGIIPFHTMEEQPWNEMAWFEYIALRTYGLSYLKQLTAGTEPYTSEKVRTILEYWKQLQNAQCFSSKFGPMQWNKVLPYWFRGKVAMVFIGQSLRGHVHTTEIQSDIGHFIFPKIAEIPRYESAPVNAFHITAQTRHVAEAKLFLAYMARPEVQAKIALPFGSIPANINSKLSDDPETHKVARELKKAKGVSAFFDRMVPPAFDVASRPYFIDFVRTGDIESFMNNMEVLRLRSYKNTKVIK